ncbi:MAG: MaoC family dehydratase [Chloroflexota bacterium]
MQHVEIGYATYFSKTVGESDVYLFAGITGDLHPNHVNDEYMRATPYGGRLAHGALLVGFMSGASTKYLMETSIGPAVSYGFDRVRFVKGVAIGDTVTVEYKIEGVVPEKSQSHAQVTVTNQRGQVVAVATHIMKYL